MAAPEANGPIQDYHAHVYFDADSRAAARAVRAAVEDRFDIEMGRWHEKMVGPHPRWSYQIKFGPDQFAGLVPWLMQNRRGLSILLHPNTGRHLEDHRDWPLWMGEVLPLDLSLFEDKP